MIRGDDEKWEFKMDVVQDLIRKDPRQFRLNTGLTGAQAWNYLKGQNNMLVSTLLAIANGFDMAPECFFEVKQQAMLVDGTGGAEKEGL